MRGPSAPSSLMSASTSSTPKVSPLQEPAVRRLAPGSRGDRGDVRNIRASCIVPSFISLRFASHHLLLGSYLRMEGSSPISDTIGMYQTVCGAKAGSDPRYRTRLPKPILSSISLPLANFPENLPPDPYILLRLLGAHEPHGGGHNPFHSEGPPQPFLDPVLVKPPSG